MHITVDLDEQMVQRARAAAAALGTSIEGLVKAYVVQLAGQGQSSIEQELEELDRLSDDGQGQSGGWKFSREEIYFKLLKTREPVDLGESAAVAVRAEREGR